MMHPIRSVIFDAAQISVFGFVIKSVIDLMVHGAVRWGDNLVYLILFPAIYVLLARFGKKKILKKVFQLEPTLKPRQFLSKFMAYMFLT